MDPKDYEGLLTIVLTLLLRCGYILVHVGCVPTTNVHNIYMQYMLNIGMTTIVYLLCGCTLTLGKDWHGFIGTKWTEDCRYTDVIRVWSYFMHSASVVQLVTAGRIHFIGEIVTASLYSTVIYSIVVHSGWSQSGWMSTISFVSGSGYQDVAGGSVIHLFSGSFALGAMLVFGGRIINVNRLDHNSLAINVQATSTLGYLMVISTTAGLMLFSPFITTEKIAVSQVSIMIALATGLVVTTVFYLLIMKTNYWTIIWIMQGGLASMITLSCGLGSNSFTTAFAFAFIGVFLYLLSSVVIRTSGIEDYCNVLSINFAQGLLGSYLVAFNDKSTGLSMTDLMNRILWQGICSTMILLFGCLSSVTIFISLSAVRLLRNKDEREICDEMDTLEYGCCMNVKRRLDASSSDLIRPGYHTFIKFGKKKSNGKVDVTEDTPCDQPKQNFSTLEPSQIKI